MIALLVAVLAILATMAFAIGLALARDEAKGQLRRLERRRLVSSASRLPGDEAARWTEEWLAEHAAMDDVPLQQLLWTFRVVLRGVRMEQAVLCEDAREGGAPFGPSAEFDLSPFDLQPGAVVVSPRRARRDVLLRSKYGIVQITNWGPTALSVCVDGDRVQVWEKGTGKPVAEFPLHAPDGRCFTIPVAVRYRDRSAFDFEDWPRPEAER